MLYNVNRWQSSDSSSGFWSIYTIYDFYHMGITSVDKRDQTKHSMESLGAVLEGDST